MSGLVTIPKWAESIAVRRRGDRLFVQGHRRIPTQAIRASEKNSSTDILAPLNVHIFQNGNYVEDRATSLHMLFTLSDDLDSLLRFVAKFGPVWGQVVNLRVKRDGTEDITVAQSVRKLRQIQRQMTFAADAVAKLKNFDTLTDDAWEVLFLEAVFLSGMCLRSDATIKVRPGKDFRVRLSKTGPVLSSALPRKMPELGAEFVKAYAHHVICRLLNKFPPIVTFFDDYLVRELPLNAPEGVLPTLYFLLRRDYLAEARSIANCANCNRLFQVIRKDQHCCSPKCSHQFRNRKHWRTRGKRRRQERMELIHNA